MLFFSYSRGNLIVVRSVAAELRRLGYRTWLDLESLRPGERWREAIDRAMAASDAMVYCLSQLSLASAWTGIELRAAQNRGLRVLPVVVDGLAIDSLPPEVQALHVIRTDAWPLHEAPAQAARAIAGSVGPPRPQGCWSDDLLDGAAGAEALRVELAPGAAGEGARLGWRSPLWTSPLAALGADALHEVARAADEARAAELCLREGVAAEDAALVLGSLVSRLGPGRVRLRVAVGEAVSVAHLAAALGLDVITC